MIRQILPCLSNNSFENALHNVAITQTSAKVPPTLNVMKYGIDHSFLILLIAIP